MNHELETMMNKIKLGLALAALSTAPAVGHDKHGHGTFSAGEPGDPKKPARTIEILMNRIIHITAALALTLSVATGAVATGAFVTAALVTGALAAGAASISGKVKKIDEGAGKITLKQGPAKSLGMDEPMTMVYRVKDPAMLKQVKVGDKVTFEAEEAASGYTVTKIERAR